MSRSITECVKSGEKTLIFTRPKVGYILDAKREDVVIFL